MSDNRKFTPPQRVKNILDNNNLILEAACPTPSGSGQTSRLTWIVTNGNPRIMIYTNDPGDQDNNHGRIVLRMTPLDFNMFMETIEEVSRSTEKVNIPINSDGFIGNPPRKELTHQINIGRDAAGVVYLVVKDMVNRARPIIKFEFNNSRTLNFVDRDGNPMPVGDFSGRSARSWVRMLTPIVNKLCAETWTEPQKRNNNQQGGGGGNRGNWNGNRNGGGGGGNWNGNRGGNSGGGNWNDNQGNQQQASQGGSADVGIDEDIPY